MGGVKNNAGTGGRREAKRMGREKMRLPCCDLICLLDGWLYFLTYEKNNVASERVKKNRIKDKVKERGTKGPFFCSRTGSISLM